MNTNIRLLLCLLLPAVTARADFQNGQSADLALGERETTRRLATPSGAAVDPVTHKVFVADQQLNRVLRFSSAESLQNGGAAEAVLGQQDFGARKFMPVSAVSMSAPSAVCMDGAGHLWVCDSNNRRVLRFDNAASLPSGAAAAGLLGQSSFANYYDAAGAAGMKGPRGIAVDSSGRLWVADSNNNRVLRFDNAAAKPPGASADGVLGQGGFDFDTAGVSAAALYWPTALALEELPNGSHRLWVADCNNNRVVGFSNPATKPNGAAATYLRGQSDWLARTEWPASASSFIHPSGLAIQGGRLWVADTKRNRVVHVTIDLSTYVGGGAVIVLGQPDFTTAGAGAGGSGLSLDVTNPSSALTSDGTRLWIADSGNSRVLRHDTAALQSNGAAASGLLGPASLDSVPATGAARFKYALATVVDPASGKVFVADAQNNRVLRFAAGSALTTHAAAEAVLGQPDFNAIAAGHTATTMSSPQALAMDRSGHLWVADSSNHRVLRFDSAATIPSGSAAAQVLGQANFTDNTSALSATGLKYPGGLAVEYSQHPLTHIWVTSRLWVADGGNHRVLRFNSPVTLANGAAAGGVLGQSSFVTGSSDVTATTLRSPRGLAVEATGRLWVADELNNRALRFDAAGSLPAGAPASGVLLQQDFVSRVSAGGPAHCFMVRSLALSPAGRLFVCDGSGRVLWFDNAAALPAGASANGVLGKPDLSAPANSWQFGWNTLANPQDCTLDAAGHLWVADETRVLRFTPALDSSIADCGLNAQSRFFLTLNARAGEAFEIRSSPDLLDWSKLETTITAAAGQSFSTMTWTDPANASGERFYRLQRP